MLKLLLATIAAVIATMFAMDNMQRVELGLIVGRPVHVRLFFLLLASFLVGSFSAMVAYLYLGTRRTKEPEAEQKSEDDDFFTD